MKKMWNFVLKRKNVLLLLVAVILGGYWVYGKYFSSTETGTRYVTAATENGMLISSVTGSGQVAAVNQIDVKSKVSGEIVNVAVKKGQEVAEGQIFAQIDSSDAQKSVRDAALALESAQVKLDELLAGTDSKTLVQAQNAMAQAERDLVNAKDNLEETKISTARSLADAYDNLEKAQDDCEEVKVDAETNLADAYSSGYNSVSTNFSKLSSYEKDLKDTAGTEQEEEKYIGDYELILGSDSFLVDNFLRDYRNAQDLFENNLDKFQGTYSSDSRESIYQLLADSADTADKMAQALESARHMFDAVASKGYSQLAIASYITSMKSKVESDNSAVYSVKDSLQKAKKNIDDTVKNNPQKIKDAEEDIVSAQEKIDDCLRNNPKKVSDAEAAIKLAEEKMEEKKIVLEDLQAGPDSLEIRSEQNAVDQKVDALRSAKEKLADYTVRAPFGGVLADVSVSKGDITGSSTVIVSLITKEKIAEISLNEIDAAKIKVGQKVNLTFDAAEDLAITGEVADVSLTGTVTQGVVSFTVKIAFDVQDERIKPAMSVSASIILEAKPNVLLVPISAVKTSGASSYVEVLVDGVPQQKNITVGSSNDTMMEIVSGLAVNEQVVTQTITSTTASSATANVSGSSSSGGNSMMGAMRMMK